ncbi:MAG: NifB/NifX family molybdenum-iron cluster-binding protein [Patescibacteria group bacterium]|nr:NifB/NifX family molybdenum-iron cluster-binding protein [Patescibacteria group bacterium]
MNICITSTGENLEAPVSPRFGRCPYFLIVDTEGEDVKVVENPSNRASRGAGVGAAQIVSEAGCDIVITGNVGPNALFALDRFGIKAYAGAAGKTGEKALEAFNARELTLVEPASSRGGRGSGPPGSGSGQGPAAKGGKGHIGRRRGNM